ncbi:hypothetical protein H7F51_17305 [Novosphingobium flavum]|uniref:Cellulose biosynthesis protein BcsS n=1 Tax=Novosphingobium flavum TaxID=1778672 RepID=A0A7X1FUN2_9SPHN|nr:TorF family putative porin [Novosphingobium flavum]MBC2667278.1 hypothetical protein [Novosphingobium flavum]
MTTTVRGLLAATALIGAFTAAPAFADEAPASDITITGSATVASQYRFRGLSQSDNLPVIQGAITATHSSGLYVGTWGSSASQGNFGSPINIGGTELDVFGGYTRDLSGTTIDLGVIGYLYPGATAGNYYEVYGSVARTYGPVKGKVGVNFAPAQKVFNYSLFSATRNNTYVYGELSSSVPGTPLSVHSHVGYTSGGFDYVRDYLDYSVGVSASYKNLTLDASLVGTDLGRGRTYAGTCTSVCGEYFYRPAKPVGVVSLTAAF